MVYDNSYDPVLRCLIAVLAIDAREQDRDDAQHDRSEDARFWSDFTSGEPCVSTETGIKQIVVRRDAAVWNSVEKRLAPIPSGVESDRPPEISGAAEDQAEQPGKQND